MCLRLRVNSERPANHRGRESATYRLSETIRIGFVVLWIAGAYGGIVYWALQGSLLDVLAATLVSFAAGGATWLVFIRLSNYESRYGSERPLSLMAQNGCHGAITE
jgi:hypothetical protein